jgi:FkbM family methyltransferase
MNERLSLRLASLLYSYAYFIYKPLYFLYKNRKDKNHLDLLRQLVKPGSRVIDIGANIGFYSTFLYRITGRNGHVYCFEPDKINFNHLINTVGRKENVTLIQKAVAATSGKLKLYPSPLLNVDHRTYASENTNGNYEVDKISIDDYVDGKFKIDFIKIDIQGFEMEALKGMKKTLAGNEDIILFIELWNHGLKKSGTSAVEVVTFLSDLKFFLYKVEPFKLSPFSKKDAFNLNEDFYSDVHIIASRKKVIPSFP